MHFCMSLRRPPRATRTDTLSAFTAPFRAAGRPTSRDRAPLYALRGRAPVAKRPLADLSQGQRQLISVARALAGRPRVVLLDEPAAGLDSDESLWLGERLQAVRNSGVTALMIEHDKNGRASYRERVCHNG